MAGAAEAADIAAGKELAAICAACHGEHGISVSDDIPNLADAAERLARHNDSD